MKVSLGKHPIYLAACEHDLCTTSMTARSISSNSTNLPPSFTRPSWRSQRFCSSSMPLVVSLFKPPDLLSFLMIDCSWRLSAFVCIHGMRIAKKKCFLHSRSLGITSSQSFTRTLTDNESPFAAVNSQSEKSNVHLSRAGKPKGVIEDFDMRNGRQTILHRSSISFW